MQNTNVTTQLNTGILPIKKSMWFLAGLLLVGVLAMTATFSSVSADAKPVHKSAGSYTVAPPVLSGPPTTENGVTFIAGTVDVTTIGAQTGVAAVDFSCTLAQAPEGSMDAKGRSSSTVPSTAKSAPTGRTCLTGSSVARMPSLPPNSKW